MINTKKAIEILQWCISNNQSLQQGCKKFNVADSYLRNTRYDINKYKLKSADINNFLNLYDNFKKTPKEKERQEGSEEHNIFTEDNTGHASYEYKGDKMITSLDEAIEFFKIDTKIWEVERYLCNSYPVSARVREQNIEWVKNSKTGGSTMLGTSIRENKWTTKVNYQVKVWLKKRVEMVQAIDFDKFFKDLLVRHKPVVYKPVKYQKAEKNLLEINIFDLHVGKLTWREETGQDYDSKIASERFRYALDQLLIRSGSYKCERILFPVGNDFFNSDTDVNTTHMGTWQSEDSRWQKTFKTGCKLLIEGIDKLREIAPVDVLVIPGNHDWTRSFFLGETLYAWYRNDKNVSINNSPNPRKYYEYGQTLLGFTHGNLEKPEALRSLMALEAKEAWARVRYKEFHCGHWHRKVTTKYAVVDKQRLTDEELGIIIRHMSSMSGTDSWHHKQGYQGPNKSAEAFVWSHEDGLQAQFNVNINI